MDIRGLVVVSMKDAEAGFVHMDVLYAHASSDQDHLLDVIRIYARGRPDKASSDSDLQFCIQYILLLLPKPRSRGIFLRHLDSKFHIWFVLLEFIRGRSDGETAGLRNSGNVHV